MCDSIGPQTFTPSDLRNALEETTWEAKMTRWLNSSLTCHEDVKSGPTAIWGSKPLFKDIDMILL